MMKRIRYQPGEVVVWERRFGYKSERWLAEVVKVNGESYRVRAMSEGRPILRTALRHNIVRLASAEETLEFKGMTYG